jgi:hypothetical protein
MEVKVTFPRNIIDGMFDAIRNSILAFALKIEAENPKAGDVPSGAQPIPLDRVTTIFLTSVSGGNALIGGEGQTHYQISESKVGVLNSGSMEDIDSIETEVEGNTSKPRRKWFWEN